MDINVWLPILTLVLGYVGSMATEILRDRRQAARELRNREEERERVRDDRREEFQIRTLLDLQEAIHTLVRIADVKVGTLDAGLDPDPEIGPKYMDALQGVNVLEVRVLDADLRKLVGDLRSVVIKALQAQTPEETSAPRDRMVKLFGEVNRRVGSRLRALYGKQSYGPQTGHTTD